MGFLRRAGAFTNDLHAGIEYTLGTFDGNIKPGEALDSFDVREAIQRDLDRPEDCMKFNESKCRILYLRPGNLGYV